MHPPGRDLLALAGLESAWAALGDTGQGPGVSKLPWSCCLLATCVAISGGPGAVLVLSRPPPRVQLLVNDSDVRPCVDSFPRAEHSRASSFLMNSQDGTWTPWRVRWPGNMLGLLEVHHPIPAAQLVLNLQARVRHTPICAPSPQYWTLAPSPWWDAQ